LAQGGEDLLVDEGLVAGSLRLLPRPKLAPGLRNLLLDRP
jgi:hypothetical protein